VKREERFVIGETAKIEKFSARELVHLRSELMQSGIDSWQAAEVLREFLTGRGYGVNSQNARDAVGRLELVGGDIDCIQEELERLAFVM
jgi:hypothetical protein